MLYHKIIIKCKNGDFSNNPLPVPLLIIKSTKIGSDQIILRKPIGLKVSQDSNNIAYGYLYYLDAPFTQIVIEDEQLARKYSLKIEKI